MKKFTAIIILSIIAFINASYLTFKSFDVDWIIALGQQPQQAFCDVNTTFSCTTVMQNPYAKIGWVIPFPLVAMFVYPLIGLLAYFGMKRKIKDAFKTLTILSGLWILFNGTFIRIETFIIKAFCPLCILCTGIIITIFTLSLIGRKSEKR